MSDTADGEGASPVTLAMVFETPGRERVGPRHIEVLNAVAATGSLTGAGRRLKLSYRGVCDAVGRLNGLFGVALVEGVIGGAGGGGARVTLAGERFRQGCDRLDLQLQALASTLQQQVVDAQRSDAPGSPAVKSFSLGGEPAHP